MEEVLLLAQMQARRHEFNPTKQNINAILRSIVYEFQNRSDIKHRLDYTSNQDNYEGFIDAKLIRQIVRNLLSNAIKYSSGAESPVVEIKSYKEDGEVVYEVKDNGAGFNNLYVDKLFGVFQRLHSNEEFEGTGVGLALVKRIITKHGGKVWANGEVNKGATFYFSLPEN